MTNHLNSCDHCKAFFPIETMTMTRGEFFCIECYDALFGASDEDDFDDSEDEQDDSNDYCEVCGIHLEDDENYVCGDCVHRHDEVDESMDGDHESAFGSIGWGEDEYYHQDDFGDL